MKAKGIKAKTRTTSTRVQAKRTTVKIRSILLNDGVHCTSVFVFCYIAIYVDDAGDGNMKVRKRMKKQAERPRQSPQSTRKNQRKNKTNKSDRSAEDKILNHLLSRIVIKQADIGAQGEHGGRGDDRRALPHLVQRVDHRGVPHKIPGGQEAFLQVINPVCFQSPPLLFLDLVTTKRRCLLQNSRSRSSTSQRSRSRWRARGCRRSRGTPSRPSSARPPPPP